MTCLPFDHNAPISTLTWKDLANDLIDSQIEWARDAAPDILFFMEPELVALRAALSLPRLTDSALTTLFHITVIEHEDNLDAFHDEPDPSMGAYVHDIANLHDLLAMEAGSRGLSPDLPL